MLSLSNKTENLEQKIAALEDRSTKSNIRLRGVPEDITTEKIKDYLCNLFKEVLPEMSTVDYQIENFHRIRKPNITEDITTEKIKDYLCNLFKEVLPEMSTVDYQIENFHRIRKPNIIASHLPRDVIVSFRSPSVKDNLIKANRIKPQTNLIYKDIIFLQDLFHFTRTWKKSFSTVTDFLRKNDIRFQWGFPASLKFIWRQEKISFTDVNEAKSWLAKIKAEK
ncbi:Hypothetical predicted protein [Pelobates cultripes]|uniref:Uncharacterized protein n=1 Tax=Pelobates cultripes TaxID=61616 RepID=A0AAD1WFW0_PELCU|nr:Hypothetical predicted protein [Pelobates cultripes]